jgi:hypothetical protein
MGFARLSGGRLVAVMDGAAPPTGPEARHAHAGTLAFELTVGAPAAGRQRRPRPPLRPGGGPRRALDRRAFDGGDRRRLLGALQPTRASPRRAYGPWIEEGPSLVTVRQAQDHTGQWLLATHDGYVETHGLLHERRLFVDARGQECRGEDIVYVTDGRARDRFDRVARAGRRAGCWWSRASTSPPASRRGSTPTARSSSSTCPAATSGSCAAPAGGSSSPTARISTPAAAAPIPTRQILVIGEVIEYLGQINWSFTRRAGLPEARPAGPRAPRMP